MTSLSTHECPAAGCGRRVAWDKLMCRPHWQMVPASLRRDVLAAWRYGAGAGEAAYLDAREAAIDAVNARLGTSAEFGNTTLFGPPGGAR